MVQNSGNLNVIAIRENAIHNPSTGQRMVFEAEQPVDPLLLRNYFAEKSTGDPEGIYWKAVQNVDAVGYMVKSPVPDDAYYYKQTHYTASFIMKTQGTLTGNLVANLEVFCLTHNMMMAQRQLYDNSVDFPDGNLKTFEVAFDLTNDPGSYNKPANILLAKQPVLSGASSCLHVDVRVYWNGFVTTWLDKVVIEDDPGKQLFSGQFDGSISNDAALFKNNYPLVKRFYLRDEPEVSSFLSYNYVQQKVLQALAPDTANRRGYAATAMDKNLLFNRFLLDAQPSELIVDVYPIHSDIPSPNYQGSDAYTNYGIVQWMSNGHYTSSLQGQIDTSLIWNGLRLAMQSASSTPVRPFWFI
ncbi:MAG: hypothetical protein ACRDGA_09475, partial [Bacteroidota bacterium]